MFFTGIRERQNRETSKEIQERKSPHHMIDDQTIQEIERAHAEMNRLEEHVDRSVNVDIQKDFEALKQTRMKLNATAQQASARKSFNSIKSSVQTEMDSNTR